MVRIQEFVGEKGEDEAGQALALQKTDGTPAEQAGASQITAGETSSHAAAPAEPATENEHTAGSAAPQASDPDGVEDDDPDCPAG